MRLLTFAAIAAFSSSESGRPRSVSFWVMEFWMSCSIVKAGEEEEEEEEERVDSPMGLAGAAAFGGGGGGGDDSSPPPLKTRWGTVFTRGLQVVPPNPSGVFRVPSGQEAAFGGFVSTVGMSP